MQSTHKDKRKNNIQMHEQSKDNGILIDESYSKKLKVFYPATPSDTNYVLSTFLIFSTYLKIKTIFFQTTQTI